jgi:DeoR family ulaG and ulaABCDEF operon transcriptional repressor
VLERERQRLILKTAEERSVVSVTDLCDLLGASEATIRRDIVAMAERGEIRRVRGGVEALEPRYQPQLVGRPFAVSQEVQAPQKRAIARVAAGMMRRGESIIIGAGSTTYCLAEFLEGMSLDILTSSFPLASHLVAQSRNRITLPGGPVYREQGIVLSPFESDVARHFRGERMFTSCYGLNRFGLMENDPLIVQSQIRLMASAETVVVLADSRKLRQQSSMIVVEPGRIGTLITDWEARPEELEPFRALGIEIIQAEPGREDGIRRVA